MKLIETLYSQGTAEYVEDGIISNSPFFGVVDGHSAPYADDPPFFDVITGGEIVRELILESFNEATAGAFLEDVLLHASHEISLPQIADEVPMDRADRLPGASFVVAKVEERATTIIQGGDCFALLMTKSGNLHISKNQHYKTEVRLRRKIAQLMEKFGSDRKKMWEEFYPFLCQQRRESVNKKYAVLNGQLEVKDCWEKTIVDTQDAKFLMFFTDGFVPFAEMSDGARLARHVTSLYLRGGLSGVLNFTRSIEDKEKAKSHIDHAEASALVVTFENS